MTRAEEQFCRDLHAKVVRLAQILAHKQGGIRVVSVPEPANTIDAGHLYESLCKLASEALDVPLTLPWCEFLHQCEHAQALGRGRILWIDGNTDLSKVLTAR